MPNMNYRVVKTHLNTFLNDLSLAKATIQKELSLQFAINPRQFVRKSTMHNELFFSTE